MKRTGFILLALALPAGCQSAPFLPEHLGRTIAVLPVNNRTGDPLVVAGEGLLDRYVFRTPTATLVEVLEGEAVYQLREKGFEVPPPTAWVRNFKGRAPTNPSEAAEMAAQAGIGPLCLYLEIRHWEADGRAHVTSVTVDVEASLIDTSRKKVIWSSERRGPVPTPGTFLVEVAYISAARKIIGDLLRSFLPDPAR
jgi:hypothetical protein